MYRYHALHLGMWLPVVLAVAAMIVAFEIWMIVDAATNKKISGETKAIWIICMLIIHPFIAIIYFFTDHRKR